MFGLERSIPVEYQPFAVLGAIAFLTFLLARLAGSSVPRLVSDNETQYRLRKAISSFAFFIVVLAAVIVFGRNITGVGVALGVAGAGIAFALQEVIASIAGWIAISLGGFYRPGDRVQLGGITGDVIDVGVLRTTIMETGGWVKGDLYNGRIVRVANSFVFKEPVYNYSGEFPFLWDEFTVPVRHGSDHKLAREILVNACEETVATLSSDAKADWEKLRNRYRLEDANLMPMVTMTINDNWIEFTLRYVVEYKQRRVTRDRVSARILESVQASDGRVELASATLEIVHPDA
ncbi:MAG: mechanosensitive ion channel [Fimbriimonadaceae bacterium]|nr:mechanosensitive ion channel [Fimbriimonadaceae bacterium]